MMPGGEIREVAVLVSPWHVRKQSASSGEPLRVSIIAHQNAATAARLTCRREGSSTRLLVRKASTSKLNSTDRDG